MSPSSASVQLPASARDLASMDCMAVRGHHALDLGLVLEQLKALDGWQYDNGVIQLKRAFKNYEQTLGFVNQVAALADAQDHHPMIEFGYSHAKIRLDTHDCGGISVKDFILAAKISQLD